MTIPKYKRDDIVSIFGDFYTVKNIHTGIYNMYEVKVVPTRYMKTTREFVEESDIESAFCFLLEAEIRGMNYRHAIKNMQYIMKGFNTYNTRSALRSVYREKPGVDTMSKTKYKTNIHMTDGKEYVFILEAYVTSDWLGYNKRVDITYDEAIAKASRLLDTCIRDYASIKSMILFDHILEEDEAQKNETFSGE